MTRLNNYLLSEGRSKQITQEEAKTLIQSNCSDILKQYKNKQYIYRGLHTTGDTVIVDTTKGLPRRSEQGFNFYTLLMDNLPSWKSYPKRSQSLICSTSNSTASNYGKVFVVFPYNNTKIGVCSKDDIWASFNFNEIGNLPVFQRNLNKILLATTQGSSSFDYDWNRLITAFKVSEEWIKNNIPEYNSIIAKYNWLKSKWYEDLKDGKPYINIFNNLMNPQKNKFQLKTPKFINLNSLQNNELWIEGKSILIELLHIKM